MATDTGSAGNPSKGKGGEKGVMGVNLKTGWEGDGGKKLVQVHKRQFQGYKKTRDS